MVKSELITLWTEKERREQRRITLTEIAEATGLSHETIRNIRDNKTSRFDEPVIVELCKYFDVPNGSSVPFLTVCYDSSR